MSNIDTTDFKFAQFRNGNGWGNTVRLASAKIVWEIQSVLLKFTDGTIGLCHLSNVRLMTKCRPDEITE